MEKNVLGIGQYVTTSTCYFEGRIDPTKVNMSLTDEAKAAVLEFLTESLDFHTLVCDIAGNVRKEVKPGKGYDNSCKEVKTMGIKLKNISINYDRLIEDYDRLNTRYNNQREYIAKYIEENKRLTNKVEKLKGELDMVYKRYGELIKTISDRDIKSI